jgi:hypothetical protein
MSDREKIIPHQLYSSQAITKLHTFTKDFMVIGPNERTMFGNIPTKKEHVLETLLVITYRQFDKEIDNLVKLIEDAKQDAFIVEKELSRYKEKYGELPAETE